MSWGSLVAMVVVMAIGLVALTVSGPVGLAGFSLGFIVALATTLLI